MDEEKKHYKSFHDIPPRDYMYFPKGTIDLGKPGEFSKIELIHIIISMIILTFAFSFALTGNQFFNFLNIINSKNSIFSLNIDLIEVLVFLPIAFLGIITAFFVHELSHKFMGQKYKLWAEYRMYPLGLLISLMLSILTGIVFAAPGAVMFRGGSRNFETGKIASAGPLANILLAIISYPLYRLVFYDDIFLGKIVGSICLINAFLASFNLLPIEPLDGIKIINWNATFWIILFIISIFLTAAIFPYINEIAFFY
jgi:Zn-dependent protease